MKGFLFGTEPYARIGYMDHPLYEKTVYFNNARIGARLNESITSYELEFSKPTNVKPPFHLYWGGPSLAISVGGKETPTARPT